MAVNGISRLSNLSDERVNRHKLEIVEEIMKRGNVSCSQLKSTIDSMTTKQLSVFLRTIEELNYFIKGNRYRYYVELDEMPTTITYGDYWITIEEIDKDGKKYLRMLSSNGTENLILKER